MPICSPLQKIEIAEMSHQNNVIVALIALVIKTSPNLNERALAHQLRMEYLSLSGFGLCPLSFRQWVILVNA